ERIAGQAPSSTEHPMVITRSADRTISSVSRWPRCPETSIPTSRMASTTSGCTASPGIVPALPASPFPSARALKKASAITLRPAWWTQTNSTWCTIPRLERGGTNACRNDPQDESGRGQPVHDERREVAPAQVRQQRPDHQEPAHGRSQDTPRERPPEARWDVFLPRQQLEALVRAGPPDDREGEQEREPRGRLTVQPEPPSGGDGDPGPGHPGLEGDGLGQPDGDGAAEPQVLHVPRLAGPAIHHEQEHAEHRQHDRDEPGLAQPVLDGLLEQRAGQRPRDGPDDQEPGQSL